MEATKLNSVDLVIGALEKDNECTKSMLDWIVARIYDIEYGSKPPQYKIDLNRSVRVLIRLCMILI
jgi:hypothetical protein